MNILSSKLKRALETEVLPDIRKVSSFYPSSASIKLSEKVNGKDVVGACLRQQYYRSIGENTTVSTPADHRISALIGDKVSLLVQELLDSMGYTCGLQRVAAEHSFYIPEINVSGRSDFVAYDNSAREVIGIEVKSVGEWKASKCIESPSGEHVLQSLIYLDYYKKKFPKLGIKKWYILYVSRTENYSIKAKKHGSPLSMIWDYYVTMDDTDGTAIVHTPRGPEKWRDYSIQNIYSRYQQLAAFIETGLLPPRDFKLFYNEEEIVDLYKRGELTRKADREKVEKWLKKGAPEGKLKIELGDQECNYCQYKGSCWPSEAPVITEDKDQPETSTHDEVPKDWF